MAASSQTSKDRPGVDILQAAGPVGTGPNRYALRMPAGIAPRPDMLDALLAAASAQSRADVVGWEALCPQAPPRVFFDPRDGIGARSAGGALLIDRTRKGPHIQLVPAARFDAAGTFAGAAAPGLTARIGPGLRGWPARFAAWCAGAAAVDAVLGCCAEYRGTGASPDRGWRVSAIVRTRPGRTETLVDALASLAAQTHPLDELVVVEDGPAGIREAVAKAGFPADIRVAIVPGPCHGPAAAANAGLAAVSGTHVFFLDDDDLVFPWHIDTLAGALASAPHCRWAAARALEIAAGAVGGNGYALSGGDADIEALRARNRFAIQSVMFETALGRDAGGFDEELGALEDWDFWLRLASRAELASVPAVTSLYYVPGNRGAFRARARRHAVYFERVRARAESATFAGSRTI